VVAVVEGERNSNFARLRSGDLYGDPALDFSILKIRKKTQKFRNPITSIP
jgi:hypothetical protein